MALLDERFDKAKALHTKRKSPSTLQNLCLDFYVNKADVIISEWKKTKENIFDKFSNNLRADLLIYLFSQAANGTIKAKELLKINFYELNYMLMNLKTVKLDFKQSRDDSHWIFSLNDFQRLLTNAAQRSPNLQYLAVTGSNGDNDDPEAEDLMSPGKGIPYLLRLKDLAHLEIFGFWYWKNDDLSKLFSHLRKLVFLKILLHTEVTASGFRNIHLLKKLEEFHFLIGNCKQEFYETSLASNYEWIYSYCAENVRSLKLIGGTNEECVDEDVGWHDVTALRLISPSIKGTSRLEYLHTKALLPRADFPNLQYLTFQGPLSANPEKFFEKFSSFTHLRDLNLANLTFDIVAKMLESVGKQLSVLYVENTSMAMSMDFFQILHLCPNLMTFHQRITCYSDNDTYEVVQQSKFRALVTKHNVRLLKDFVVVCDGKEVGGLFELILFAPLLEHVVLYKMTVSRAECQLLHDVLEGHFLHLKIMNLSGLDLGTWCSMDDLGLFVQCLVCSAPRLYNLNVSWRDGYLRRKWDSEQTVAQSFLQLLSN